VLSVTPRIISVTPRTITVRGHELGYLDSGAGPTVMLIHGLLGSSRSWTPLIEHLSPAHRVLAPDLFGHGASAKPMGDYSLGAHAATLRDMLDQLGIDRLTLVGHSLGGGIAMQFCYLFPHRVERLALISSGGLGRSISPLLRGATIPGAGWVLPLIASTWVRDRAATLERTLSRIGWHPGSEMAEAWDGFTSLSDADSRRAFLATIRSVVDPGGQTVNAHDQLPTTTHVPTLIIWGTRDRIIPAAHATTALKAINGSRLELFEGAGHFPHLAEPERFAETLTHFIGG